MADGDELERPAAVPRLFYGTAWKEERTGELTALALASGFRAIDTANQRKHYVEAAVGEAVKAFLGSGAATRSRLFLQSKFTHRAGQDDRLPYDPHAPVGVQVQQSFESSLTHFGTTYLDAFLLHGPTTGRGLNRSDWEVWRAMEGLARAGKVDRIGVSNVSAEQLALLYDGATVKPAFVQNRCYARTGWDRDVRTFAAGHAIGYQAFSLLTANRRELAGATVRALAAKHQRPPTQLVFAFALAVGMTPLTGTSDPAHMREDLAAPELGLDAEEIARLEHLPEG